MKTQLTCLSLILSVNLFSQSKIPLDFFLNAWMPDEQGNIYSWVYCSYPVTLNNQYYDSDNGRTLFFKTDPSGQILWVKQYKIYGEITDCEIHGNRICFSGMFCGQFQVNSVHLTGTTCDGFAGVMDLNGNLFWAVALAEPKYTPVTTLSVDHSDNLYVCSTFSDSVKIGNQPYYRSLTAGSEESHVYMAKFSPTGQFIYSLILDSYQGGMTGDIAIYNNSIALVAAASATPAYGGLSIVKGQQVTHLTNSTSSALILKTDLDGNILHHTFLDTGAWEVRDIKFDSCGNLYISAGFNTKFVINEDLALMNSNPPGVQALLMKYTSQNITEWVVHAGNGGRAWPSEVALDSAGQIYWGGAYQNTSEFISSSSGSFGSFSSTYKRLFAMKMDPSGSVSWLKSHTGIDDESYPYSLAVSKAGEVYVAGGFYGTVFLDNITLQSRTYPTRPSDPFLLKITDDDLTGINEEKQGFISVFPVPAKNKVTIENSFPSASTCRIYDVYGKAVKELMLLPGANSCLLDLPKGVYFLSVENRKERVVRKIVID